MKRVALVVLMIGLAACQGTTAPLVQRHCRVWQNAGQAVPSGTSVHGTTLSYDAGDCTFLAQRDSLSLPAGTWLVSVQVTWAQNDAGKRGICLFLNGTTVLAEAGAPAMLNVGTIQTVTATVTSNGSQFITTTGSQTSGTALATLAGHAPDNVLTFVSFTKLD